MKIAVLGASGWIGSHIVNEAKARGHEVIALVRNPDSFEAENVEARQFDLLDQNSDITAAVDGAEVVISAIGGRSAGNHDIVAKTAEMLLTQLPQSTASRLLWVGGAGSLEVAPGVKLITVPKFPDEYKPEAVAMGEALQVFRSLESDVNWTFVSPAADIFPGEKQAPYRVGGDMLLTDSEGNSRISVADYAVAMIDELESAKHANQRIGVAY